MICEHGAKMRKSKLSPEVRERDVRMVLKPRGDYASQSACTESIVGKIGCTAQTLDNWIKPHERDSGQRHRFTNVKAQRIRGLEWGNRELRKVNEVLKLARALFYRPGVARPPAEVMYALVDEHRDTQGFEPICAVLKITPSTSRMHAARRHDPSLRNPRTQRDSELLHRIE